MGIGELGYFIGRRPDTSNGQAAAFLSGFLLIMVGLIVAGPWLTMVGARVLA
jgi:putative Mn2+ efflux pump MntP